MNIESIKGKCIVWNTDDGKLFVQHVDTVNYEKFQERIKENYPYLSFFSYENYFSCKNDEIEFIVEPTENEKFVVMITTTKYARLFVEKYGFDIEDRTAIYRKEVESIDELENVFKWYIDLFYIPGLDYSLKGKYKNNFQLFCHENEDWLNRFIFTIGLVPYAKYFKYVNENKDYSNGILDRKLFSKNCDVVTVDSDVANEIISDYYEFVKTHYMCEE